jgi:hypothetical protein
VRSEASRQRAGIAEIRGGAARGLPRGGRISLAFRSLAARGNCCSTSMWLPSRSAKTKPRTIVGRPLTIRTPTVTIDNFARVLTIAPGVCPCEERVRDHRASLQDEPCDPCSTARLSSQALTTKICSSALLLSLGSHALISLSSAVAVWTLECLRAGL